MAKSPIYMTWSICPVLFMVHPHVFDKLHNESLSYKITFGLHSFRISVPNPIKTEWNETSFEKI